MDECDEEDGFPYSRVTELIVDFCLDSIVQICKCLFINSTVWNSDFL